MTKSENLVTDPIEARGRLAFHRFRPQSFTMSTVLLIALLALAVVAMFKIQDSFRELTFEFRKRCSTIEERVARLEECQRERALAQQELEEAIEGRGRGHAVPTLDEIMKDVA